MKKNIMVESPHECILYDKVEDEEMTVQCKCCCKRCVIGKDESGFCGVRYNHDGKLYLSVYGRPCALQVDPIEKKPLYHFLPGTKAFSIGTVGCNFHCDFCQNWDISQAVPHDTKSTYDIEDICSTIRRSSSYYSPESLVDLAVNRGCKSIAFTYNEPTIWGEYAHDIARLAVDRGLKCIYVTNGYMTPEHLDYIKPYVSALNIDLKAWSSKFYREVCGGTMNPVKETIRYAKKLGMWVEVTTLVIPGENDSDDDLNHIAQFLASVSVMIPWHVTAFHPDYKMTDKSRTSVRTLQKAIEIGKKAGLKHVYVGNVVCDGCEDTYCPKCSTKLVKREWMKVHVINGSEFYGKCWKCNDTVEGVWE